MKSLDRVTKQDRETYHPPKTVQALIPIKRIWPDGIFLVGGKYTKVYRFSDINYLVASREDKESMFLRYSDLLNGLDSGATTKITINNHRASKRDFEKDILMPMRGDDLDQYRKEYNQMLLDKATNGNGIMQEKYLTISVQKKDIEEARAYFNRTGADLISHFAKLGSKCVELDATQRLQVLHDFYRSGEESFFHFDMASMYGFTPEQRSQLTELLSDDKRSMWSSVLYGIGIGDGDIVTVALSQIGNVGGDPYWSWYGFDSRVDWCACFVSWCANECGYIEDGIIPKFAGCSTGFQWFSDRGLWQGNSYEPRPGDLIFFDWDKEGRGQDGAPDHVGIVEKVENGYVYTVEGNTGDSCREKSYALGYYEIFGYGTPAY